MHEDVPKVTQISNRKIHVVKLRSRYHNHRKKTFIDTTFKTKHYNNEKNEIELLVSHLLPSLPHCTML